MKYIAGIFLLLMMILVLNCGLEESGISYNEPENVEVKEDELDRVYISFDGYNQEGYGAVYTFVGYRIFYSFPDDSNELKAVVRYPKVANIPSDPTTDENPTLINFFQLNEHFSNDAPRFDYDAASTPAVFVDIYKNISLPVTLSMIEDVLTETNGENVRIYFHDDEENGLLSDETIIIQSNPYQSSSDYIFIDNVYPNPTEISGWLTYVSGLGLDDLTDVVANFKGFYDYYFMRYKEYKGDLATGSIEAGTESGVFYYSVDFYIEALGFIDEYKTTRKLLETKMDSSPKSDIVTVKFKVERP